MEKCLVNVHWVKSKVAVTHPLLENAFLKKFLVSGESHFLIGRFSHPFYKAWLKGLHFVAHRCVVTFG